MRNRCIKFVFDLKKILRIGCKFVTLVLKNKQHHFHSEIWLKIVYFSYLYDIKGISAGSANKATGFVSGLRKLGHNVSIFWRSDQPESFQYDSVRIQILKHLKKHLSNYLHDPKKVLINLIHLVQEYRILKNERPTILFLRSELYNVSACLLSQWFRIPMVLEVDCPTSYEYRRMWTHNRFIFPVLPEWIERWNWKTSLAIITISDLLKNYMARRGVPETKITVVPNGADPDVFKSLPGDNEIRQNCGIPNRAVIVGWIGSLYGWSGLENLLDMSKRILDFRKDVALLFVGGGKNKEVIEQTFQRKDVGKRVFTTGTIPYKDVPKFVNAMDVVIVPYPKREFWYPSSMKLFEYMAAQKAIVASAVPQVNEVIQNGWNGFLFDPENLDEFTNKVLKLVDSPTLRKRLSTNARKTVLEKYTWIKHARKMEAVFQEVLKVPRMRPWPRYRHEKKDGR
jgi:glycosyltransferase involved in cell wall biosynthesis